jgi:AcrR family transcriptional regulator
MPSSTSNIDRPIPQQKRSSRRVAEYLDVAANLFAEVGYDAATMTAIAERAGSSIGGLYRYFPDKQTLAIALLKQYTADFEEVWTSALPELKSISVAEFAEHLIDRMTEFVTSRPAYFILHTAPIRFRRDAATRTQLRTEFSKAFLVKCPSLSQEVALLAAHVTVQITKGMLSACADVDTKRRSPMVREFKRALTNYLRDVLRER